MKVLITGVAGMVGSHMLDFFRQKKEVEVTGLYFRPTINFADIEGKASLLECDVRYYAPLCSVMSRIMPDVVYHLAAQSYPSVSWERPQETIEVNVNGTINVFESIKAIRKQAPGYDPVVVVACSSAEYGASLTPENVPIDESMALLPLHPYGVSKVAQDLLSYQYFVNDGIKCIRARIFNTTGPRKTSDVASDFTLRAIRIEKGLDASGRLRVGNLGTSRAITDVRDLVQALVFLAEKGRYGDVYNISGSRAYMISEVLEIIKSRVKADFSVEVDPALLRPTDEPIIFGDSSKLIRDTQWSQKISLEQTVSDMLDYWRLCL